MQLFENRARGFVSFARWVSSTLVVTLSLVLMAGRSNGDPVGPFPLGIGTPTPFPWNSAAGIWQVKWQDQSQRELSIAIEVRQAVGGERIVSILTFDPETFVAELAGRGVESVPGKVVSAALVGAGKQKLLSMWQVSVSDPAGGQTRNRMMISLEDIDSVDQKQGSNRQIGVAERVSQQSFEAFLRSKCGITRRRAQNPRDSEGRCQ